MCILRVALLRLRAVRFALWLRFETSIAAPGFEYWLRLDTGLHVGCIVFCAFRLERGDKDTMIMSHIT